MCRVVDIYLLAGCRGRMRGIKKVHISPDTFHGVMDPPQHAALWAREFCTSSEGPVDVCLLFVGVKHHILNIPWLLQVGGLTEQILRRHADSTHPQTP